MLVTEQILGNEVPKKLPATEYIVVAVVSSKILLITNSYQEAKNLCSKIAQAGGSATIFKSIK